MDKNPCPYCGGVMKGKAENYRYTASGLDGIVLAGITVWRCTACGESGAEIPHVQELHDLIARELVNKPSRLAPKEIRFLRKHMGWSGVEFARHMGVEPEVVSRWENKAGIGALADRTLRLMVQVVKPTTDYSVDSLVSIDEGKTANLRRKFRHGKKDWELQVAA